MTGLTVCGQLLPAVGLALLMKMIWTKEIGVYYLLGFVLFIYLKLPIVAIAVLGIVAIVAIGVRDFEINQIKRQKITAMANNSDDEVEDFLG